ncbi:unnamed protein product [Linum trigynum]|uniref:Uncharacterized protein n=1 Tax=Linum trigynum TaxID=586398 RepID=A0AAV2GUN2_9ROSI
MQTDFGMAGCRPAQRGTGRRSGMVPAENCWLLAASRGGRGEVAAAEGRGWMAATSRWRSKGRRRCDSQGGRWSIRGPPAEGDGRWRWVGQVAPRQ